MRTLARWIARHRKLSAIIAFVFWTALAFLYILADGPLWLVLIVGLFGMLICNAVINTAPAQAIKQEAKAFVDHCDPYPMIEAIPELLQYEHADWIELALERDYCNALNESGQYQAAYDRLKSINIDKSSAPLPGLKVLYYVSLYESCVGLDLNDQAEIWYQKAITIFRDAKEDNLKKHIAASMAITMGNYELQRGNLDKATEHHEQAQENTMIERVMRRFLLARILLKQGKTDEARNALEYVVSNGNRLHTVTLAKELLETI